MNKVMKISHNLFTHAFQFFEFDLVAVDGLHLVRLTRWQVSLRRVQLHLLLLYLLRHELLQLRNVLDYLNFIRQAQFRQEQLALIPLVLPERTIRT